MSQSPVSGPGSYPAFTPPTVDGFHGVWYGYTDGTYYAGGLGTFPQQIHPMAYHAAKAGERGRTFFVYGGAKAGVPGNLLTTISYYDHATGLVARPRILNDRQTNDGHDNPSMMLDREGHIYVFVTPTEANDTTTPRQWRTAHFNRASKQWVIRDAFVSDNNYDHGTFSIEPDGLWRVIAPTAPGPQPGRTGGDMELWTSGDEGATWQRRSRLTHGGPFNHAYARQPVQAHDDFYAFWADGDVNGESASALYFTDRHGTAVWRLPRVMGGDFAKPEPAFTPIKGAELG